MLEPARDQIEIFAEALFRYAPDNSYVSLRAFYHDAKKFRITPVRLNGKGFRFLFEAAEDDARRAAQAPKPVVFCPPICTFKNPKRAREEDLAAGLALSVELDQHPHGSLTQLEEIIGPATIIVRSGGIWIDPDGAPQDKLHVHWRLAAPARGENLAKLKTARALATRIAGGDASSIPSVHPLRWPGSWHRKDKPRMCEIARSDTDREIDLDAALSALRAAAPAEEQERPRENGADYAGDRADWAALIRNVIAGRDLHDSTVRLAAAYAGSGVAEHIAVRSIEALYLASTAQHDERWRERFDDIPRGVRTGYEKYGNGETGNTKSNDEPIAFIDAGEDDWNVPPREWLLGNMFCREFVSSLLGNGGTGKTALRYTEYLSLAVGRSLTGEHVFQRCRVLVVSLEDSLKELRRRIKAVCLHHGIAQTELRGWLFYVALGAKSGKLMTSDEKGRLVVGTLAAKLEQEIIDRRADLVALDPFVKTHSVEENSNSAIDDVVQILSDLAIKHSIGIDAPHHTSKGLADPGNASRGRGASAMKDAARLVYTVSPMSPEEAQTLGISEAERQIPDQGGLRQGQHRSANDRGEMVPARWRSARQCNRAIP